MTDDHYDPDEGPDEQVAFSLTFAWWLDIAYPRGLHVYQNYNVLHAAWLAGEVPEDYNK
jgi:hypothetical protein